MLGKQTSSFAAGPALAGCSVSNFFSSRHLILNWGAPMLIVVFSGIRTSDVDITARIAANGPSIDALFRLYDTNDPSQKVELAPQGQQGVSAAWTVSAAALAAVAGPVYDFALWLANLSQYSGSIDIWTKMVQNGAPLPGIGSNGLPLTPNAQGEFLLDSLAYGSNDTCPLYLKL